MKNNCPDCGELVDVKTFDGKGKKAEYYYEERPRTPIEIKLEKRLGLPFRHMVKHECQDVCLDCDHNSGEEPIGCVGCEEHSKFKPLIS